MQIFFVGRHINTITIMDDFSIKLQKKIIMADKKKNCDEKNSIQYLIPKMKKGHPRVSC